MTFQSDQKVRSQIMDVLGADQLFRLLLDPDVNILMKTLGLMRNLLSNKQHIDTIMICNASRVMQAVTLILEGDHPPEVKEQVRLVGLYTRPTHGLCLVTLCSLLSRPSVY